jgi:Zn-finger nucleic acid-binding protein
MPLLICPNCDTATQAVRRSGVEFDLCPQCRGIWLDRGELEKLMSAARDEVTPVPVQPRLPDYERHARRRDHDDDSGRARKKRFDVFDIFD